MGPTHFVWRVESHFSLANVKKVAYRVRIRSYKLASKDFLIEGQGDLCIWVPKLQQHACLWWILCSCSYSWLSTIQTQGAAVVLAPNYWVRNRWHTIHHTQIVHDSWPRWRWHHVTAIWNLKQKLRTRFLGHFSQDFIQLRNLQIESKMIMRGRFLFSFFLTLWVQIIKYSSK